MSFVRSSVRRPSNGRSDTVVHAVGQRVYVSGAGDGPTHVELMDDGGTTPIGTLVDGAEVMVVAWKPRGSAGTRYRVRCTSDGREGWLAAANLRRARTRAAAPVESAPSATPAVQPARAAAEHGNSKPRFGAR